MSILEFAEQFPNEQVCREHFRSIREKEGLVCKKCGGKKHYWLKAKWQWQCSNCRFRTGLRSGTLMESANLPVRTWFLAMAFMSFSKKGISASELKRQLNHNRYESIWSMMHRIRDAMGERDALYTLGGMVEFDEGFFETATPKGTTLKRGRGSQKQANVAVMAESTPLEDLDTGHRSKHFRYLKMEALQTQKAESINDLIQEKLDDLSIVFSDKSTSYVDIADFVEAHYTEKSDSLSASTNLQWVHIQISNAKRAFLGIYHKISGKNLQRYLNEFCYKVNRRYFGKRLFDRLLIAMGTQYWYVSG